MKKIIKFIIVTLIVVLLVCIVLLTSNKKTEKEVLDNGEYIEKIEKPDERYTKIKEDYDYNEFEYANINTENLIRIYYNKYLSNVVNNIEEAYEMLDDEYKQKKFKDLDEYREYIDNNKEAILSSSLKQYNQNNTNEGYIQYVCIDQNDKYFIIRETAVMQFKIILDTYTIDLPEFIEKYNSTNEQGKVALNIQKFTQSLNEKDYSYAYNCLSEGFKDNYFKEIEDFENYIKDNLYENIIVSYDSFEEVTGLYRYTITIKNADNEEESIQKTIIMKLNEGTDFEMSFDV